MEYSLYDATKALEAKEKLKRVVEGTPAEEGRFDYATALLFSGQQFCGGSVIAPRAILTASHCLDPIRADFVSVRTQCVDISNRDNCETIVGVKKVLHPDYDRSTLSNDVAILILAEDSTAPLLKIASQDFVLPDETPVTTIGWGRTDAPGSSGTSDILLEADIEVVDSDFCENQFDRIFSVFLDVPFEELAANQTTIDDTMICTLADEKSACNGDSGGPLLLRCDETKEDVAVGVVSFGIGCAYEGTPTVYAKTFTPETFDFISSTVFQETGFNISTVDSLQDFCLVGGTKAPTVAEEAPTPFPTFFEQNRDLWTCPPEFFARNDGCDCDCGIPDPDCQSDFAEVFGCRGFPCFANGTCNFQVEEEGDENPAAEVNEENDVVVFVLVAVVASLVVIAGIGFFVFKFGKQRKNDALSEDQQEPNETIVAKEDSI